MSDVDGNEAPVVAVQRGLYKVGEAADLLRLTAATVRAWIRAGRIRAVKLGPRTTLVTQSEIDRLLSVCASSH